MRTVAQSIAVAASVLIIYVGLCHEFVGAIVYPFGPALFGGPVGWHTFGILVMVVGLLLLAGVVDGARIPVTLLSLVVVVIGVALVWYVSAVYGRIHFLALSAVFAALTVAVCDRVARTHGHA